MAAPEAPRIRFPQSAAAVEEVELGPRPSPPHEGGGGRRTGIAVTTGAPAEAGVGPTAAAARNESSAAGVPVDGVAAGRKEAVTPASPGQPTLPANCQLVGITTREAKVDEELLETAQMLSEISELGTERRGAERQHVLLLATTPHQDLAPEELVLELPSGLRVSGKNLQTITELLQPTQVLLQTGLRRFSLTTADAVISNGSLVLALSQEAGREDHRTSGGDGEGDGDGEGEADIEGRLFKCFTCSLTFSRRGNYVRHKKIHSINTEEDPRYKCPHCERQFLQHCDLRRHQHVHAGTQPHRCPLCGKGFLRASDLVVHQRFHTKERPFRCSQCHRAFYQSGDLRRHVRNIHMTNARMVICHHCHKKYSNEATLLHHIQAIHQDPQLSPAQGEGQQHTSEVALCEGASAAGEADVTGADTGCVMSEPPERAEENGKDILLEEVPATVFASETHPFPGQTEVYLQSLGTVSVRHSAAHS